MAKRREIDNGYDVIDSRDLIAFLNDKEGDRDAATLDAQDATDPDSVWRLPDGTIFDGSWSEDDEDEYQKLKAFAEECEGYAADYRHGEALIRDSFFETYARQLAEDCGMVKDTDSWPGRCIDWEQAAEELQADYTSAEWDGVTYWMRS